MKRYAMEELKKWKNKDNRKPLLLMGARQVGKTWLMMEFGKTEFKKLAYISFYNNKRMADVFETDYDINRILMTFNIETGVTVTPGDTLIVLDEIQNAPKALEALKYFCEDAPEYHVIAAGSLLGVALHGGVSFPVGKVDMMELHPLSFREFLLAMGENGLEAALLTRDYTLIDTFRDKYIYWLKHYYYIGGMPEVVAGFAKTHDYNAARDVQQALLINYRIDFGKHADDRALTKINMVWASIPIQLAKENKKFFFGQVKKGARAGDFETAIQWLCDAGLVRKVSRVNEPHIPLEAYKDFSTYKLFLLDVGLLGAMSGLDASSILDGNEMFVEFKGALTEQYVLQQLIADTPYTPYYFGTEKSTFEQDFLIQQQKRVVPIEVKAETNVKSQSLKAFIEKYKSERAVRFSLLPYIDQGRMVNIPLYAVCNL